MTIDNGSAVDGRAGAIRNALASDGFSSSLISTGNAAPTAKIAIYYPSTKADSAAAVAGALGVPASALHVSASRSTVTVILGKDWTSGTTFGSSTGTTAGSGSGSGSVAGAGSGGQPGTVASSPPADSFASNAADNTSCMAVPRNEW